MNAPSTTSKRAELTETWRGKGETPQAAALFADSAPAKDVRALLWRLLSKRKAIAAAAALCAVLQNVAIAIGPYLISRGVDKGIPQLIDHHDPKRLYLITGGLVVLGVIQAVASYGAVFLVGRAGEGAIYDLRRSLFAHIQRLGIDFGERFTSGRVISRLTSDVEAVEDVLYGGMDSLVATTLTVISVSVMLFILDWHLAILVVGAGVGVAALTIWYRRSVETTYRHAREAVALVIMHFVESLRGIAAVQAFRREERGEAIFTELNERYRVTKQRSTRLNAVYSPSLQALGNITIALMLLIGGKRVIDGDMTVGVLTAFLLYMRQLIEPIIDFSQFYTLFQAASAALEKIAVVFNQRPVVAEPKEPVILTECSGDVVFRNLTFGYDSHVILQDFNVHIPAGQTVALVGTTGAGKSTIARLLSRFYDPQRGEVTLDDVNLRNIMGEQLRDHVIMVTQENFLFTASIAENIAFGHPDAIRDDIESVAKVLGIHDFICTLPNGYDTTVGKRGAHFSAGERQLISFARAMLANPQVLILDEATSSLDLPSERRVQQALETLLAGRTAVIIAHRLSTIQIADRVLVIEQGRIAEDAPPSKVSFGAS